ncbi:hypothetical protein N9934_05730, partial [Desulfosarcina sp.]|nr:hypothetical protein [Desulfosarcina sp.]
EMNHCKDIGLWYGNMSSILHRMKNNKESLEYGIKAFNAFSEVNSNHNYKKTKLLLDDIFKDLIDNDISYLKKSCNVNNCLIELCKKYNIKD